MKRTFKLSRSETDSWMTAPHNENDPVGRIDLALIADGLA